MLRILHKAMPHNNYPYTINTYDNVIRSNCAAAVAIPVSCRKEFEVFVSSFGATLQNEYADTDANVTVSCEDTEAKAAHLCRGYRRASACSYDITEWG